MVFKKSTFCGYHDINKLFCLSNSSPGGGVTSSNVWYPGSARKKMYSMKSKFFCENEGSKRFKTNEKGVQFDCKLREK